MGKVLPQLKLRDVLDRVEEEIRKLIGSELPGKEKFDQVVDKVVSWLDEKIQFKGPVGMIIESVDHLVLRYVLGLVVQHVYDELKEAGEIQ